MSEFLNEENEKNEVKNNLISLIVEYCPYCTMPFEYCEYGPCYEERCLPYLQQNHPEILSPIGGTVMTTTMATTINESNNLNNEINNLKISDESNGNENENEGEGEGNEGDDNENEKKKKKRGGPKLKKVIELETKVILTKVQRQKRKYVTVVAGLESVPNLKIKDATKLFGKRFSSGASINEGQNGVKEVVIQGDVLLELPSLLISQFNVSFSFLYFMLLFVQYSFLFSLFYY